MHITGGVWLTLQAARIAGPSGTSVPQAELAVTIELASPRDRAAIYTAANGFTEREAEILQRLLAGADTHELADGLHLAEHTVQDHLKSIFAKTGTHSRRQLLSEVVGSG